MAIVRAKLSEKFIKTLKGFMSDKALTKDEAKKLRKIAIAEAKNDGASPEVIKKYADAFQKIANNKKTQSAASEYFVGVTGELRALWAARISMEFIFAIIESVREDADDSERDLGEVRRAIAQRHGEVVIQVTDESGVVVEIPVSSSHKAEGPKLLEQLDALLRKDPRTAELYLDYGNPQFKLALKWVD